MEGVIWLAVMFKMCECVIVCLVRAIKLKPATRIAPHRTAPHQKTNPVGFVDEQWKWTPVGNMNGTAVASSTRSSGSSSATGGELESKAIPGACLGASATMEKCVTVSTVGISGYRSSYYNSG